MTMPNNHVVENSLQQKVLQAFHENPTLGDKELRELGFNPLIDLARLSAIIYQLKKIIHPDTISTSVRGSSKGKNGLNPVLIYKKNS